MDRGDVPMMTGGSGACGVEEGEGVGDVGVGVGGGELVEGMGGLVMG